MSAEKETKKRSRASVACAACRMRRTKVCTTCASPICVYIPHNPSFCDTTVRNIDEMYSVFLCLGREYVSSASEVKWTASSVTMMNGNGKLSGLETRSAVQRLTGL